VQVPVLADALAKCLNVLARMMPILVFTLFGAFLMASSVRVALAEALKHADVLVTGFLAVSGWGLSSYLDNVDKRFDDAAALTNKRFDDADALTNKRFDDADALTNKRFDDVNTQLKTLTELLMPRRK
jgi:hypothetical protein